MLLVSPARTSLFNQKWIMVLLKTPDWTEDRKKEIMIKAFFNDILNRTHNMSLRREKNFVPLLFACCSRNVVIGDSRYHSGQGPAWHLGGWAGWGAERSATALLEGSCEGRPSSETATLPSQTVEKSCWRVHMFLGRKKETKRIKTEPKITKYVFSVSNLASYRKYYSTLSNKIHKCNKFQQICF